MTKNLKLQLTFDDGPLPEQKALDPILAELAKRKVTAAFFVLGNEVDQKPAAAKKIIDAKHVLGNHSWDHLEPKTSDYSDADIVKQFKDTHAVVLNKVGFTMVNWRAPRGDLGPNKQRLPNLLTGAGKLYTLSHCDWRADSKDSQHVTTADGMLAALNADLAVFPGTETRVLFHVLEATATALPKVLDGLVAAGHTFVDFRQTQ